MGGTARSEQGARAKAREARIAKARERRLELDKGREARDARIDAAVADVYLALDERLEALQVAEQADLKMGAAIRRVLAEGVPLAQAAELTELTPNQVQKLRTLGDDRADGDAEDGVAAVPGRSAERSPDRAPAPVRPAPAAVAS
jgi:hypothetical protein